MTRSKRRQRRNRRGFEATSTLVWGRVRAVRTVRVRNLLLLLLLVVVAAGGLWLTFDDRFYVYSADVVGAGRVSPDEVFRASGLPGLHVLWVRSAEVEARILAALPSLESAQVECGPQMQALSAGLPAECTITIVERQPKVMWDDDGQLWWIDADGILFPAYGGPSGSWLVRGPLPRGEDGWLDESVRIALTELWTIGADVSPLLYVPGRGLVFTDERGWRVIVGQGPGMVERLLVLERLAADLEARNLTPRFVDVRFSDAPYYSLTNEW